ncbi:unnamed protein product [Cochlearia groenlandica]
MVVDNAERISKGDSDVSMATHDGRDNSSGEIISDGKDHLNRFRVDTCSVFPSMHDRHVGDWCPLQVSFVGLSY